MGNLIKQRICISIASAFCIVFYSCIDEPEIDPVTQPFSTVRVGNFSTESFTLQIDGENKGTLGVNEVMDWIDMTSGQRTYTITSPDS